MIIVRVHTDLRKSLNLKLTISRHGKFLRKTFLLEKCRQWDVVIEFYHKKHVARTSE